MKLEDLRVYQMAMELGEKVWVTVMKWEWFEKRGMGMQLTDAADSVASNISEGFGRYHFKDAKKFYYYSRGSLSETKTWITKAKNRSLITLEEFDQYILDIDDLGVRLNNYINSIGR